jgi:hypothetical protein
MAPGTAPIAAPHLARLQAEALRERNPLLISILLKDATGMDIEAVFLSGWTTSVSDVDDSTRPVTVRISDVHTRILAPTPIAGGA